jgi:hypothetical protein
VVTLEPEPWLDEELESLDEDEPLDAEPLFLDVDLPVLVEPVVRLAFACWVAVAVDELPSEPVPAISPKAMTKVATAAATTRRRSARARRARALRRSRTRSEFEVGGGVEVMPGTLGTASQGLLGASWEIAECGV